MYNGACCKENKRGNMDRITTTIKREFLADIVAGTKTTEFREVKPYWNNKFRKVRVPFELRLINGMSKKAPEVTVLIDLIEYSYGEPAEWALHIQKVLKVRNWRNHGNKKTKRQRFSQNCGSSHNRLRGILGSFSQRVGRFFDSLARNRISRRYSNRSFLYLLNKQLIVSTKNL